MLKRLISVVMLCMLLAGLMPMPGAAADELAFGEYGKLPFEEGFFEYKYFTAFRYNQGFRFSDGLAWITSPGGLYGAINKNGETVIPFIWEGYLDLGDGYAYVVRVESRKMQRCVLDRKGHSIFGEATPTFEAFGAAFADGMTWAKLKTGFVLVSTEGEIIPLEAGLTPVAGFCDGRLMVVNADGLYGYVNTAGELVIPCEWASAYPFSQGYAAVMDGSITEREESDDPDIRYDVTNWLFIDKDGAPLNDQHYSAVRSFCNGRAAVCNKAYRWGYLNLQGQLVLGYRWRSAGDFHADRAPVSHPDLDPDMAGFIDGDGELETPWRFEMFGHFSEGACPAYYYPDGGRIYINKYGTTLGSYKQKSWASNSNIINGYGVVSDGQGWGYVNASGTLEIPCTWSVAMPFSEDLAWVESNDWRGFINGKGRKVIDCTEIGRE